MNELELLQSGEYLRVGKLICDRNKASAEWASGVLSRAKQIAGASEPPVNAILDAIVDAGIHRTSGSKELFRKLRKQTHRFDEMVDWTKVQSVMHSLCILGENVAKVVANEVDGAEFDEDSGHWIVWNVYEIVCALGIDIPNQVTLEIANPTKPNKKGA